MVTQPITLFSWGYHGWGNATEQFVSAVDAIEKSRGYGPPVFVDIRFSRSVRAKGFRASMFENTVKPLRYQWMPRLGNRNKGKTWDHGCLIVDLVDPGAAVELLDLAETCAARQRRAVFFCHCAFPLEGGKLHCHRQEVGTLVLREAQKQRVGIEVIEWPGGEPRAEEIEVEGSLVKSVRRGRKNVPLKSPPLHLKALPWGSVLRLFAHHDALRVVSGPACVHAGQWVLPVFETYEGRVPQSKCMRAGRTFRQEQGLDGRIGDFG